ncbi:hypothetical protein D9M68_591730 [compost metagenome]
MGRVPTGIDADRRQCLLGHTHAQHGVDLGAEHADRRWHLPFFCAHLHHPEDGLLMPRHRARLVGEEHVDRTRRHLFEAQRERALDLLPLHGLDRQGEGRRAAGAVVVHVEDRDAADGHPVERRLPRATVAVDVAAEGLLDQCVVDAGVLERRACSLFAHDVVAFRLTRLAEGHHAHPGDNDFGTHSDLLAVRGRGFCLRVTEYPQSLAPWSRRAAS